MTQENEWDRGLWVADKYALRCCNCNCRFNLIRRRHHCRQCGQVFCNDCLLTPNSTLTRNFLTDAISSLVGLQRQGGLKVCQQCDRLLRQRQACRRTGLYGFPKAKSVPVTYATALLEMGGTLEDACVPPSSPSVKDAPMREKCLISCSTLTESSPRSADRLDTSDRLLSPIVNHSLILQPPKARLPTHPEGIKEKEVSYSISEIPLYSHNSMTEWLSKLLKETRGDEVSKIFDLSEVLCVKPLFKPHPVAFFTLVKNVTESGVFATMFLPPAPQDVVKCLERESSRHLIKRTSRLFANAMITLKLNQEGEKKEEANEKKDDDKILLDNCVKMTINPVDWIAKICDLSWQVISRAAMIMKEHISERFDVIGIAGGALTDTEVISGVAFVQNVASKRMKVFVQSPKILLLSGDVGTSLKPQINLLEYVEGYEGYLGKLYQRIDTWNPSVIVVEGSMHHYLHKRILNESQATLILHAGKANLHRLSRCCNAHIVEDLQYVGPADLRNPTILGSCETFQLVRVGEKPVCIFRGPPKPLFVTILLRGGEPVQLEAVKFVLIGSVAAAYHLALQAHFVCDMGMRMVPSETPTKSDSVTSSDGNDLDSCMKLISFPPRDEDRIETLSINVGVNFPNEVKEMDDQHDNLMWDNIVVNTIFLDCVNGGGTDDGMTLQNSALTSSSVPSAFAVAVPTSGFAACSAGGVSIHASTAATATSTTTTATATAATANYSVRQCREVFPFYGEGDETLLDHLSARVKEGDSIRLVVHSHRRLWVKTSTDFNSSTQAQRIGSEHVELSSFRSALNQISMMAEKGGQGVRREHMEHIFPPLCYATCHECFHSTSGSLFPCSLHTLSISWGAFLEFLVYGSSRFALSCGHNLSTSLALSFIFFPHAGTEVTITITLESLFTYTIIPPSPVLPTCNDVAKLYLKDEIEELRLMLEGVNSAIEAGMKLVTSASNQALFTPQVQQQTPLPPSRPPFFVMRGNTFSAEVVVNEDDTSKATVLRHRVDEMLTKLTLLQSADEVTQLRLESLWNLLDDFWEWNKNFVASVERRTGKKPPIVDADKLNDPHWSYNSHDKCCVRLNEPTGLVAAALQITLEDNHNTNSSYTGNGSSGVPPCSSDESRCVDKSEPQSCQGHSESQQNQEGANTEEQMNMESSPSGTEEDELFFFGEELLQLSLEDTMKAMLGPEPTLSPPIPSSSSFVRSTTGALDILTRRNISVPQKSTLKHIMNLWVPADKSSQATVIVEIMFPQQFEALRYLYTEGRMSDFTHSLLRCRAFQPQGGKTKSDFFITRDERFVMKQLKQAELRHFVEFGPNYFTHMAEMYNREPLDETEMGTLESFGSCLVKIFGVFSIQIKRGKRYTEARDEIRYYVLMENLFFTRQADIVYDLKGSQRNRTAPKRSDVLLDQDLVGNLRKGSFFYCTNDVKSFLMDSLTCDAHLLSSSSIMDYSLLVALNQERREIYLGIIDYLHPYTGAKVIESKVKAGLETVLGHSGRDPTIIDPVNYRARFAKWMDGCFCGVPEKTFAVKRALANKQRRRGK